MNRRNKILLTHFIILAVLIAVSFYTVLNDASALCLDCGSGVYDDVCQGTYSGNQDNYCSTECDDNNDPVTVCNSWYGGSGTSGVQIYNRGYRCQSTSGVPSYDSSSKKSAYCSIENTRDPGCRSIYKCWSGKCGAECSTGETRSDKYYCSSTTVSGNPVQTVMKQVYGCSSNCAWSDVDASDEQVVACSGGRENDMCIEGRSSCNQCGYAGDHDGDGVITRVCPSPSTFNSEKGRCEYTTASNCEIGYITQNVQAGCEPSPRYGYGNFDCSGCCIDSGNGCELDTSDQGCDSYCTASEGVTCIPGSYNYNLCIKPVDSDCGGKDTICNGLDDDKDGLIDEDFGTCSSDCDTYDGIYTSGNLVVYRDYYCGCSTTTNTAHCNMIKTDLEGYIRIGIDSSVNSITLKEVEYENEGKLAVAFAQGPSYNSQDNAVYNPSTFDTFTSGLNPSLSGKTGNWEFLIIGNVFNPDVSNDRVRIDYIDGLAKSSTQFEPAYFRINSNQVGEITAENPYILNAGRDSSEAGRINAESTNTVDIETEQGTFENIHADVEIQTSEYYGDTCYLNEVGISCDTGETLGDDQKCHKTPACKKSETCAQTGYGCSYDSSTVSCEASKEAYAGCCEFDCDGDINEESKSCEKLSSSAPEYAANYCAFYECYLDESSNTCQARNPLFGPAVSSECCTTLTQVSCEEEPKASGFSISKKTEQGQLCGQNIYLDWAYCGQYDYYYDLAAFATTERRLPIQVFEELSSGVIAYDFLPKCGNAFLDTDKGESCLSCPGDIYIENENDYSVYTPSKEELKAEQYWSCDTNADCPKTSVDGTLLGSVSCVTASDGITKYCQWDKPVIDRKFEGQTLRCKSASDCITGSESEEDWLCLNEEGLALTNDEEGFCFNVKNEERDETPLCVLFESEAAYPCKNWGNTTCEQKLRAEFERAKFPNSTFESGKIVCDASCSAKDEAGCVILVDPNPAKNDKTFQVEAKKADNCACTGYGEDGYCCPSDYRKVRVEAGTGWCCPSGTGGVYDESPKDGSDPAYRCCPPEKKNWIWYKNTGKEGWEGRCSSDPTELCGFDFGKVECFFGLLGSNIFAITSILQTCDFNQDFLALLDGFLCVINSGLLKPLSKVFTDMVICVGGSRGDWISTGMCLIDKGVVGSAQVAVDFITTVLNINLPLKDLNNLISNIQDALDDLLDVLCFWC